MCGIDETEHTNPDLEALPQPQQEDCVPNSLPRIKHPGKECTSTQEILESQISSNGGDVASHNHFGTVFNFNFCPCHCVCRTMKSQSIQYPQDAHGDGDLGHDQPSTPKSEGSFHTVIGSSQVETEWVVIGCDETSSTISKGAPEGGDLSPSYQSVHTVQVQTSSTKKVSRSIKSGFSSAFAKIRKIRRPKGRLVEKGYGGHMSDLSFLVLPWNRGK